MPVDTARHRGHRAAPATGFADQADLLLGRVGAPPTGAGDDLDALDRHDANHAAKPATHSGGADLQLSAHRPLFPQGSLQTTLTINLRLVAE
ncbi:MAG: hypothetical protein NVV74_08900 [Magnetospirillum sp.]|nr:hypothetical protein [Magnetospirillum sp.]